MVKSSPNSWISEMEVSPVRAHSADGRDFVILPLVASVFLSFLLENVNELFVVQSIDGNQRGERL